MSWNGHRGKEGLPGAALEDQPVLDHGYVKFIAQMGSDSDIVRAARMSTAKGFEGWDPVKKCSRCGVHTLDEETAPDLKCAHVWEMMTKGDAKLLAFLYENRHMTPFEMCELHIEVQAPIMVFREWHRHRTQSYNEMSARYVPLPDINYIPTVERLLINSKTNKQAGTIAGADELTPENAEQFRINLQRMYEGQEKLYQQALQFGVPKELARVHLPVGRYSRMRAKTDLRNWLAFSELRMAPNAQWEIRQYANAVAAILQTLWPRTYALYEEYTLRGMRLSRQETMLLAHIIRNEVPSQVRAEGSETEKLFSKIKKAAWQRGDAP